MSIKRAGGSRTTGPARLVNDTPLHAYLLAQLTDTPIVQWPMQETSGTSATDLSGNSRTGTIAGTPTMNQSFATGTLKGMSFNNDINKQISVASASWMNTATAAFTAEIIAQPSSFSTYSHMCGRSDLSAANQFYLRYHATSGVIDAQFVGVSTSTTLSTVATYSTGVTYHVASVYNGATLKIYVNGSEAASTALVAGNKQSITSPLQVGRVNYGSYPFQGLLAGFAQYDTALSSARILAHAQAAGLA